LQHIIDISADEWLDVVNEASEAFRLLANSAWADLRAEAQMATHSENSRYVALY
jgi:hypothetical protein